MNSKSAIRTVLLAALIPLALGGCSLFKAHSDWDKAVESRPLEIPPDLQAPATNSELVVPEGGSQSGARRVAGTSTAVDGLSVNDTVESTFQRIGTALTRASVGAVVSSNDASRTYEVDVQIKRTTGDEGGFFKRLVTRKRVQTLTQRVNIGVSSDGSGSRVSISGDSAAVKRVSDVLRERLG